ncbi:hypothetical protein JDV02_004444 [Purpureocillium takamizusanense]|uniref:Uncharacterized protein n=1 Tax=Purpureocillium takamizusanense TaxID=2060973 RepID=A0A9Q8QGD2_9HYPO|nr:uncharacterized protein JDV02_004444 [Purpureocillium takamizusanense]UNI18157.1 hypothetical protein JDV02_004444 [Purpureocillium takamizusanense]
METSMDPSSSPVKPQPPGQQRDPPGVGGIPRISNRSKRPPAWAPVAPSAAEAHCRPGNGQAGSFHWVRNGTRLVTAWYRRGGRQPKRARWATEKEGSPGGRGRGAVFGVLETDQANSQPALANLAPTHEIRTTYGI